MKIEHDKLDVLMESAEYQAVRRKAEAAFYGTLSNYLGGGCHSMKWDDAIELAFKNMGDIIIDYVQGATGQDFVPAEQADIQRLIGCV